MLVIKKYLQNKTIYEIVPKDNIDTTNIVATPNIRFRQHNNKKFIRWCHEEHRRLHEICCLFLTFVEQINMKRYAIKLDKDAFLRSVVKFLYKTK